MSLTTASVVPYSLTPGDPALHGGPPRAAVGHEAATPHIHDFLRLLMNRLARTDAS